MADDNKSLLDTLSNTTLPALPSEPAAEPTEPSTEVATEERGRSPEEVVQPTEAREARLPADKEEAPTPQKGKAAEKLYEVRGVKYTLKQLEAAGLLEDLTVTHGKHQHLQEKYNSLLAEKGQAPAPAEAPAAPQITNAMIAQTYDQAATMIANDLVKSNLAESDLFEAYPRAMQTLVGQMRYAFDVIFSNQEKLDRLIAETVGTKEKVQGQVVHNVYNQQLDALVAKDPKLYAGLKDPKTRKEFTDYLVSEVHATVGDTTGDSAPKFLSKQWVAFNSDTVIEAAKNGTAEKQKASNRRFVMGESTGSRTGVVDVGEKSVLDNLIERSGKITE